MQWFHVSQNQKRQKDIVVAMDIIFIQILKWQAYYPLCMGYAFFSNCLAMGCHFSKHISTRCTFMISAGGSKNSKICKLTRCVSYETIIYYKMILCIHFFPMMQKLVATKCNSTICNFRKIRHKTTLGYRQGLNIPI